MAIPVIITDGVRNARIDELSHSQEVILFEHHQIHKGANYRASIRQVVGSGNSINLSITTPSSATRCHLTVFVGSGNSSNIAFYENTVLTANTGNAITPRNANRNFHDTSESVVKSNATVNTSNSTTLTLSFIGQPGATPANPDVGGTSEGRFEWILKPNKNYSVIMTETGSVSQLMEIAFDWYEHATLE